MSPFAAALGPHLSELEHSARAREQEQRRIEAEASARAIAPRKHLDEQQLMRLIFAHLDHENPRVCEGIDFDRLLITSESEPELGSGPEPGQELEPSDADSAGIVPVKGEPQAEPVGVRVAALAKGWVGASWSDELGPIIELVDRPQLTPLQVELIRSAGRQPLAELNLRHLDRHAALRHLELFVQVCQLERKSVCRVITGKGVFSASDPVLKRVVLEWCIARPPRPSGRDRVLAWAPELDQHGEWGALVLRLRRAKLR